MDSLSNLFRNIGNSLELETVLSTLDQELRRLIDYDSFSVHLAEDGGLVAAYASGGVVAWLQTNAGLGVLARVARERRLVQQQIPGDSGRSGPALLFPLEYRENSTGTVAVLVIHRDGGEDFAEGEPEVLQAIAPKLAAAIENARKYRRAERLAETDPLTGLANVRSLFQRLDAEVARARRGRDTLAVLQCSVQGFERTGRLCSEAATRSAFEKVGVKLRENCREYDFTARSGDELVLVLPGFLKAYLTEKCETIQRVVEQVGADAGFPLFAVIGAAFFPDDGTDAEDLLAAAAYQVQRARR